MAAKREKVKEKLESFRKARRKSEHGIEMKINRMFHKHGIKREAYHGGALNGVCLHQTIDADC